MPPCRPMALVALGLILAAGCSPKGAAGSAAPGAPAAAPAAGPDVVINEADLPHPKPGLWQVTMTTDGDPPRVARHCETGETIKPREVGKDCSTFTIKRTFLGVVTIDSVCATGPISSSMHMSVSGDFNSSYTSDAVGVMTFNGHPPETIKSHSEAHYVGPCPAGGDTGGTD